MDDFYNETPSTVQQVAAYRNGQIETENPMNQLKARADRAMRGTLQGMSSMVRKNGFDTGGGTASGIAEIEREDG
jgi:hypothetical protein